jgi:hypothetical protein
MYFVGLDIHTTRISICVLGKGGQLVRRCQVRGIPEMLAVLKALPDRFEVCYEASCGYGHYYDLLRPLAARVVVAHPGRLRLIFRSRNKNDRNDAERLAKLLYLGETPTVHVPSLDVRTWRELGSDMAQCDAAAGVNGSNRIMSHGAPPRRMMPNGCLGSPGLVLPRS